MRRAILRAAVAVLLAGAGLVPPAAVRAETKLSLSVSAVREVEQDTLVASLAVRATGASPREVQASVNTQMAAALELARPLTAVRLATGGYRVWQERDREGRARGWIATQDLRLTSRDATAVLDLVGALQAKGLVVGGLAYTLGREARDALEAELTREALTALRARAGLIADSLGLAVASIESLRVGGIDRPPVPRPMVMRAEAAAADAAPPPTALPDRELVSLGVDAEVRLEPR